MDSSGIRASMSLALSTRAFPAERSVLPEIRRFVEAEAGRRDFPDTVGDLLLAVTEACSNSIVHTAPASAEDLRRKIERYVRDLVADGQEDDIAVLILRAR